MDSTLFHTVMPELILAVGAMVLLMAGVFMPKGEASGRIISWLAIGVLVLATFAVLEGSGTQSLFDGAFISDAFSRFLKVIILVSAALTLVITFDDFGRERLMLFEYPVLFLIATLGMLLMVSANDLIALYLGLEMHSLALYVIAAFKRDDVRSSEAGLKYFVLGALSSGMLLYGASLIYGVTGVTGYAGIAAAAKAPEMAANIGLTVGLVFVLVGLAFKISAVPFHMWTPDVYQGAPTPVTAFFAGAPKVAAMALILRFTLAALPGIAPQWQQIVIFLAIASMALGAFAAIGQTNIKRLLAYSSIGHVGFALIGLAADNTEGTAGVLIYLTIYVVMTLCAFACVLTMRRKHGNVEDINDLAGLAKTDLTFAAIMAILMFSLAGIPPLAGFWAKWYVFLPAIKAGLYPLAVIGVVTSVVGAFYYLRIVKIMFFDESAEAFLPRESKTFAVMALSAVFVLLFFLPFIGGTLVDAANAAAAALAQPQTL
ncbi:NADH-quinone oxidoreductase subunit NuoN [Hyphomicrobium sp.]|jgi:NADH-quinone oxidoreductase subunit N|uniref:NADH-quinone oxidoreductase subunit NuoN n=1 Tax=Hyphomicrobium sp. TaxID=82 RepID=UPI002B59A9BD|nr:NADH-quinone oxidoreductase subunit NuoN [Hyphomicrobium sp.]HVZ04204.1 NADH-quinone oxidoreductase subunit NuoN [Hyphomicrobium sp.]